MNWLNLGASIVCGTIGLMLLFPFMGQGPAIGIYCLIGAWHFMGEIKTGDKS